MTYVFENVKVGDQFKPFPTKVKGGNVITIESPGGIITVTELTTKGFKYTVEKPYHCYPARWGPSLVSSGEMFIHDHPEEMWNRQYEKV